MMRFNCHWARMEDSGIPIGDSFFRFCCLTDQGSPSVMQHVVSVEPSSLVLHSIYP